MTEDQEKQPVYIVNDERVDPDGNPVKGSRSASEPDADADDTKQAAKRKSQSEKAE